MVATVAATISTLRARVHATLRHSDDSRGGRRWRAFQLLVLGSGLLALTVSSLPSWPDPVEHVLAYLFALVAVVFLVEYALRLWSAPESPRYSGLSESRARLAWAFSATGLIGLLAVVP